MSTINCTNRVAVPAYPGQSTLITLNGAESLSVLPVLAVGQLATNNSNSVTGYIDFVDTSGHQFRVKPVAPNKQFNTGNTNTLLNNELITITY